MKPFIRWAGGKGQLLKELDKYYRESKMYYEPFLGGGALFFHKQPKRSILSDSNEELIGAYKVVRNEVEALIQHLQNHPINDPIHYYDVRSQDPKDLSPLERASRFIYLNKSGFNGLYRVNKKGQFNVPFGTPNAICDAERLRDCSEVLKFADLVCSNFENILQAATKGDFVYLDPPYVPLSRTASFTAYQKSGFGMEQQEKLARCFEDLVNKGAKVLLSNSDVQWVRDRYQNFETHSVMARRSINSNASKRGPVGEVLVWGGK